MNEFRNDANALLDVMSDLRAEKAKIDEKINHTYILFRLIELSENYSTSVLERDIKRDDFIHFCHNVLVDDLLPILRSYPKFANALLNALLIHNVDEVWLKFLNVYDFDMFSIEKLDKVHDRLRKNSYLIKNYDDYKILESLLDYIIDSSQNNEMVDVNVVEDKTKSVDEEIVIEEAEDVLVSAIADSPKIIEAIVGFIGDLEFDDDTVDNTTTTNVSSV